jgi:methionine sulfoxide reductase heme-binding subunit
MSNIFPLERWQIVKWSTIIIAIVFLLILFANGINESSFRIVIRFTARSSCVLFLLAFAASSLRRIKKNPLTNWLLTNRRYLGLSMAISHGFHALAIAGVAIFTTENMVRDNHGANLGYLFIILMTITSFQHPAAVLGRRNWRILHTVGMYYLWLSFMVAFSERLFESWSLYLPFISALSLTFILRFIPTKQKLQQN